MSAWILIFSLSALVLSLLLVIPLSRRTKNWGKRQRLSASDIEALVRLSEQRGFEQFVKRPYLDGQILAFSGHNARGYTSVEVFDGFKVPSYRIHSFFREALDQGIDIRTEHQMEISTWLLRLRETEIGDEDLDKAFLFLSRDRERLREILSSPLRQHLLALKDQVDDIRLSDHGLFIYVARPGHAEDVDALLSQARRLLSQLTGVATTLGPITSLQRRAFSTTSGEAYPRNRVADEDMDQEPGAADPGLGDAASPHHEKNSAP